MSKQRFEGWFTDPYGIHEARWLSDGRPTKLVRDGGVESHDEPPPGAPSVVPERLERTPLQITVTISFAPTMRSGPIPTTHLRK